MNEILNINFLNIIHACFDHISNNTMLMQGTLKVISNFSQNALAKCNLQVFIYIRYLYRYLYIYIRYLY